MSKPTFTLTLVDARGGHVPAVMRLRSAIKMLLRSFGLRVVKLTESTPAAESGESATKDGPCAD